MRTRRLFAQRLLVLTTLLTVPAVMEEPAQAVGEQNARLQGTILEAGTGVPMPGAKVTVRSDALIGGSKSILTDDEGRFDFLSLPHGTYEVTIEYEGDKLGESEGILHTKWLLEKIQTEFAPLYA